MTSTSIVSCIKLFYEHYFFDINVSLYRLLCTAELQGPSSQQ